jgi:hypothetical protein
MSWDVWYQSEVKQMGGGYRKGTLTIEPGKATLTLDEETIEMAPIRSVGRQRMSLWLFWVDVEYGPEGEVRHAYVGDRRMLGWRGMLGSNSQLAEELSAAQSAPPT